MPNAILNADKKLKAHAQREIWRKAARQAAKQALHRAFDLIEASVSAPARTHA